MGRNGNSKDVCCVNGRYRRTIGKFENAEGNIAPKKFLLGTSERAARLASLRLEQLWEDVVRLTHQEDEERARMHTKWLAEMAEQGVTVPDARPPQAREALWTDEALQIAEEIRKGQPQIVIVVPEGLEVSDKAYVQHLESFRRRYPSVSFVPGDAAAFTRGQAVFKEDAQRHADRAAEAASIAEAPIPAAAGQTLFAAMDNFIDWVKSTKVKDGKITSWGKVLCDQVERLKESTPDLPLDRLDLNAIESIKCYWASRPKAKVSGKPIALDTVRAQLNALKLLLKWVHRNPAWKWRKPEDFEEAVKCDLTQLMNDDEIASLGKGVETYTVPELAILWGYATDKERILIALALNAGFARAECVTLRLDEVDHTTQPPRIRRVRRKSHVYGEWCLWDVTVRALDWIAKERAKVARPDNSWVLLTEHGNQMQQHRVANIWNRLLDRIQKDEPQFRRLAFKFLRKTGAQLVRNMSDGETAAIYLAHGEPVKNDDLAGVYSNPVFGRLDQALVRVREILAPVFDASHDAFSRPRINGSPNLTRGTLDRIREFHAAGLRPEEIASRAGVSRATAYRHVSRLRAEEKEPAPTQAGAA